MPEIDPILQKYLQGKTSEEENVLLYQWLQQSPENKNRLYAEKDIWDTLGIHSNRKIYDVNTELELLRHQIEQKQFPQSIPFRRILQMAAILLVVFGLGWASQFIPFTNNQLAVQTTNQEIFVPKGQVNQVFLADGTRIWINSETRLIIPSVFTSKERVVKLSGEAFFEVAKDEKRPFKVEVNGQQIEVLGTSFNIRAYDNSNEIETTLETGRIRLHTGNKITLLEPGEQSIFNRKTEQLTLTTVNPIIFSSWKDGRYEFQHKDLMEVFKVVERWYDVKFTMDEAYFKGMHFTGVIKRNKDASYFLEMLNQTIPIKYEISLDEIKITHKLDNQKTKITQTKRGR
jgi:transmembrane sensor